MSYYLVAGVLAGFTVGLILTPRFDADIAVYATLACAMIGLVAGGAIDFLKSRRSR